jgi:hypothetical protein
MSNQLKNLNLTDFMLLELFTTIFRSDDQQQYFETGNNGAYANSRISQRGLQEWHWVGCTRSSAEDGNKLCSHAPQLPFCRNEFLMKVVLAADVQNIFPTSHCIQRQLALDMVASKASVDNHSTQNKKGDALPTHCALFPAPPICHLLPVLRVGKSLSARRKTGHGLGPK